MRPILIIHQNGDLNVQRRHLLFFWKPSESPPLGAPLTPGVFQQPRCRAATQAMITRRCRLQNHPTPRPLCRFISWASLSVVVGCPQAPLPSALIRLHILSSSCGNRWSLALISLNIGSYASVVALVVWGPTSKFSCCRSAYLISSSEAPQWVTLLPQPPPVEHKRLLVLVCILKLALLLLQNAKLSVVV